jgi:hypothetical protein
MLKTIAAALLVVTGFTAQAATRCEDGSGGVTYVEGNCPQGTSAKRKVGAAPMVEDAEKQTATQRATQEYKDAERLRIAREKCEAKVAASNGRAQRANSAKARACEGLAVRVKRAKENEKVVTPKTAEREKLKRVRLEEDYARQCGK